MADDEKTMVKEMREAFFEVHPLGFWQKLHGSRFQSGLPDLLIVLERAAALVEAKWIRDEALIHVPIYTAADTLLTQMQAHQLSHVSALDAPLRARILMGFKVEADELPHGEATFVAGFDLSRSKHDFDGWSMADLAGVYLHARLKGEWPDNLPHYIDCQLRCRGDQWRAAPLVLGMKPWKKNERGQDGRTN